METNLTKIRPKKSLGQNYLIDENISKKIVSTFNIKKGEIILEIGSGKGEITGHIIKNTSKLIAVELDNNNAAFLKTKFPNILLINDNFLKVDLKKLLLNYPESKKAKLRVIGNIPYNISSEIIFKLIENREIIKDAQLMMQEELARRIVSGPSTKEYGRLSIMTQVYCKPELLFKVSRNCFYPKPGVDSRIIYFDFGINRIKQINNLKFFSKFVQTAFMSRRKMLRYTIKKLGIEDKKIQQDFDFSRRIDGMSVDEIIELCNALPEGDYK